MAAGGKALGAATVTIAFVVQTMTAKLVGYPGSMMVPVIIAIIAAVLAWKEQGRDTLARTAAITTLIGIAVLLVCFAVLAMEGHTGPAY